MRKFAKYCAAVAVAVGVSGCASMKHGPYEKVSIVSEPAGVLCKIYREGQGYVKSISTSNEAASYVYTGDNQGHTVSRPGEKYIKRSEGALEIVCSKPGYKTLRIVHSPKTNSDTAGNISNLGAGLAVDIANAGHYDLPEVFRIRLEKE